MSDKKPEEIKEEIQKKPEESEKKAQEYLLGWQRARADLLNYKKEEMERINEFLKYANEEFILKILPVLDSFNAAVKELDEASTKGVLQIKTQLEDLLKAQGLEEIKSSGEKFDPNLHEAVAEAEGKEPGIVGEENKFSSSPFTEARVVEEIQKGYQLNGRIIRPAKVKISK